MCGELVTRRCSTFTRSRNVYLGNFIRGWILLFDGDDDTPFDNASIATAKYLLVSIRLPASDGLKFSCAVRPPAHVRESTMFARSEFIVPNVLYPIVRSRIIAPFSSR